MLPLIFLLVVAALGSADVDARPRARQAEAAPAAPAMPSFPLYNTAVSGLRIPALGVGLGGYGFNPAVGYGGYPECFDEAHGCGGYTEQTVFTWLTDLTGRRLDAANTYGCDLGMGRGIKKSGVSRGELFVLEKIGPGQDKDKPGHTHRCQTALQLRRLTTRTRFTHHRFLDWCLYACTLSGQFDIPLGYNETHIQFRQILADTQLEYVDLLLIHWPTQVVPQSSDPYCRWNVPTHDERLCRLSTWKAMLEIYDSGKARAVGVSNYNATHLQEIVDAGLRLPAYNQCPFNLYRSRTQQATRAYCAAHNITFGGYSPLGVPDEQIYPQSTGMAWTPMADTRVTTIASKHGVSPAQVLLQWQYQLGIPTQARSQNKAHMAENLALYGLGLTLSSDEMASLNGAPQDLCTFDASWYECANVTQSEVDKMTVVPHFL